MVGDVVGDFVVGESLENSVGGSVGLMVANVGDDASIPVGGNILVLLLNSVLSDDPVKSPTINLSSIFI